MLKRDSLTKLAFSYSPIFTKHIPGNIVSKHQQRIIVAFMSVNCGKSATDAELEANMQTGHRGAKEILQYDNSQTTTVVHSLVQRMCATVAGDEHQRQQ